ncbi:DegT/DnrJ/EryC1/StrS family aminotransferase [Polyangium mundeleinium]|uniref:DegT/DnrJ/EryC1/StrS family aminotransferase n=1 Tax=Polyangium mundeleinium TaxID=2995306 RepID=A0ABT5EM84_9BACT|nr:DegT/DnrJ/EryC1/StrS family aminotransferase [Polyangium mundeleinium]MDC0742933.1 DegT/DnrJ/EryC1/StrS family aminotransferase [Polyangium mundeleinium]
MTARRPLPSDQVASGRSFDDAELENLRAVLASGTLTVTRGTFAVRLEKSFAEMLGVAHVHACSSGTAAVHAAVAALDPEPGSEIITSSITDFGGVGPILWQGCIPVFADVDPDSLLITAATIERCITDRTRGIIVTHLFGNPAAIDAIVALGRSRSIPVIEDCAQAYGSRIDGRHVGSFGDIACFSLQQGKHITTGEGGLVAAADGALARRLHQFVNKARVYSDPWPDHHFLAMNLRMTELQAAVALAQLDKLERGVAARRVAARLLDEAVAQIEGLSPLSSHPRGLHSYWRYALRVDPALIAGGPTALGAQLAERGVPCAPHYQRPAFEWSMMRSQKTFGTSRYPFTLARPEALDYSDERFPGTRRGLADVLVLPWTERYEPEHVETIAAALREAVGVCTASTSRPRRTRWEALVAGAHEVRSTRPIGEAHPVRAQIDDSNLEQVWQIVEPVHDLHRPDAQAAVRRMLLDRVPPLAELAASIAARLSCPPHFCVVQGVDWQRAAPGRHRGLIVALLSLLGRVSDDNAYNAHSGILTEDVRPTAPGSTDVTYRYDCEVHADESSKPMPEDIVSLWSVRPAHDGGSNLIWSVQDIVRALEAQEGGDHALRTLREARFPFGGKLRRPPRVLLAPILFGTDGIRFRLGAIADGFASLGREPTVEQVDAIDMLVHAITTTAPYEHLLGPGEALFLLNRRTLHARTLFTDPDRYLIKARAYNDELSNSRHDHDVGWSDADA